MKNKIIAALLAFFLGHWGFHWFYLNNVEKGKKYLLWCVIGILTSWLLIGLGILLVLRILALVDAFTFAMKTDDSFNEAYGPIKQILKD